MFFFIRHKGGAARQRTISSPIPQAGIVGSYAQTNPSPSASRPLSPGPGIRCYACGQAQVSYMSF